MIGKPYKNSQIFRSWEIRDIASFMFEVRFVYGQWEYSVNMDILQDFHIIYKVEYTYSRYGLVEKLVVNNIKSTGQSPRLSNPCRLWCVDG